MEWTQEFIDELIKCDKHILKSPTNLKLEFGHYRTSFELQSSDEKYFFSVFGRYNAMFYENFSVGLVFIPKNEKGTYIILRCNGLHGEHRMFPHHSYYHIHKITPDAIHEGLKEEAVIEITEKYSNFEDALNFFVRYIHIDIADITKHFPSKDSQLKMFE